MQSSKRCKGEHIMAHTTRMFQVPLLLFIMVFLVLGVWSVWAQDGLLQESGSTARSTLSEIQQLADSTGGSGDRFGWSISLDDDTLFVGSPYIGSRGSVFIFERDPDGTWNEHEVLSGDGIRPDDAFGISLALERDTAVIGAPASPMDLAFQAIIGFIVGFKGLYVLMHMQEVTMDPPAFLLSATGNFFGGIAVAALFSWLLSREKE